MTRTHEKIELKLPLLVTRAARGFLACGYINVETCNRTGEACAIVSGVKTHEDMLVAKVKAVSESAAQLGAQPGMSGAEVLALFD